MAFRMSTSLKNHLCNTGVVSALAGTTGASGTASLRLYTGTQPASADSGTSGIMLCEITGIGWDNATNGTSTFNSTAGYTGTAVQAGTIGWARMECISALGTCRIDGDAGTSSLNVFTINVPVLEVSGLVALNSANIYMA
jgi:hypothetical protein